jgi:hypothetical protein
VELHESAAPPAVQPFVIAEAAILKVVRMRKASLTAVLIALLYAALAVAGGGEALAQTKYDRPGGDYARVNVPSRDPAACALLCERDGKCRSWSFNSPNERTEGAYCWLKSSVPPRIESNFSVSGVRGAGVIEKRSSNREVSIDRYGGDYKNFEVKEADGDAVCQAACNDDNKCRAWTYTQPGYVGRTGRCFLKSQIKQPRRTPGRISGVVR